MKDTNTNYDHSDCLPYIAIVCAEHICQSTQMQFFAISMFSFIRVNTDKGSVFFFRVQLWIMQSLDWDMHYTVIWTKYTENIEIKTGETVKLSYRNTSINITNILHCHCEHKDHLLSLLFESFLLTFSEMNK